MPVGKARVNCRRCYEIVTGERKVGRDSLFSLPWEVRNSALDAVERIEDPDLRTRAEQACDECDYTRPAISDVLTRMYGA